MHFSDPKVAAVWARYAARAEGDVAAMAALGPDGLSRRDEFLLPVGEEVAGVLHALVLAQRPARILELGTSYGYSTLCLADAARTVGARLVSMDVADYKQAHAAGQLAEAGLADVVEFRCGYAVQLIGEDDGEYGLVLLDIWKNLYVACFDALAPKVAPGGIIVADNMLEPAYDRPAARAYRSAVHAHGGFDSALLRVGQGIELSVKKTADHALDGQPA